jgi:threonylcarbamoyladenosine tRNA methylthiotransferase MtaB
LLRVLSALGLDVTFRISSLEPMDCTPEIVALVAASGGRLAPHFHLPLQHASDRMLAAMRRPYTRAYFERLTSRIVELLPHASIGTDMIVGFPGETDADFAANVQYLEGAPLSHVHVFPYSDRPGTDASVLGDKVAGPTIRARASRLRSLGGSLSGRFRAAQIGSIRDALTLDDGSVAVTDNYLKVRIGPGLTRNVRVRVRIDAADEHQVIGAVC